MEVVLAVVCDYANVSMEGKLNILGVFQELNPQVLPYSHPQMYLVVSFEAGAAEVGQQKHFRIVLLDTDGNEILLMEVRLWLKAARPGGRSYINQVVGLQLTTFQRTGDHAFHILVNGEEEDGSLYVNEPPQEGGG
jgi:hypothetical protein